MTANLPRPSSVENVSTTLSSGITDVAGTMTVADASNIVSPCYLVIDRVDSAGTLKSTGLWEYVKVTNVSGNDLTVTRSQNGSTGQAHSAGAVVEAVVTSAHFEDWYASLNPEHTSAGGHVITGTMTVAGMNLASVATIANAGIGVANIASHLNATASVSGIGLSLNPVWHAAGYASAATTNVMRLTMPRAGTFKYFNITTGSPVSTASLSVALYTVGSGASIFDTIGRPVVLGGGTFVSTASIKAPNFTQGQTIRMDIETGGNVLDVTLMGVAY